MIAFSFYTVCAFIQILFNIHFCNIRFAFIQERSEQKIAELKSVLTENDLASIEAKKGENNGESTITSTSELNRVLQVLKNQARNNRRNNVDDFEGRADRANGGLPLGESGGDRKRTSQKGDGNSDVRYSLKGSQLTDIEERGIKGDKLLDVIDLAETIESVKGK